MYPILFELPLPDSTSLEITSYRAAYVAAVIVALAIAWMLARRDGLPARSSLVALLVTAAALPIGARLWHAVTNPMIYINEPWRLWTLQASGHALFGGILLASLSGLLATKLLRIDAWRLADAAAPALGSGIIVTRLGCFANGCCFGLPTDGPTGVTFPPGSYAHLWEIAHGFVGLFEAPLAVHPTQLYEAVGVLACIAMWALVRTFGAPSGVPFLSFAASFAVVRALNWTVRVPPDTLAEPGIYGPIYAATVVVCTILVITRLATSRYSPSRYGRSS